MWWSGKEGLLSNLLGNYGEKKKTGKIIISIVGSGFYLNKN